MHDWICDLYLYLNYYFNNFDYDIFLSRKDKILKKFKDINNQILNNNYLKNEENNDLIEKINKINIKEEGKIQKIKKIKKSNMFLQMQLK